VKRVALGVAVLLCLNPAVRAYSVLTHEAIIDTAWDSHIKPLLLARFPDAAPAALRDARAHAYAGSILQDMGYYPFGSRFFSDLVHYVRSGDFVVNLIRESQDLNEYAFALGALAHYASDTEGHPIAVNRSVPIEYPRLARKFGRVVTYEDNPTAHLRVEFAFDVLQVSRGNYAPQSYHDFIGFQVATGVLERAFRDTYSLELRDVFGDLDLALATYRRAVSVVIPQISSAAWHIRKKELAAAAPGITRRKFVYNISRETYRHEWKDRWREPGIGARILAFLIRILPKVGPLKVLAFKAPTPQTEKLFENSFDKTMEVYRALLKQPDLTQSQLADRDFDTGEATRPTEYWMADNCYATLVIKLAQRPQSSVDPKLRQNILAFYSNLDLPFRTRQDAKQWRQTLAALDKLKAQPAEPAGSPVR
jgi:hypothetical protein